MLKIVQVLFQYSAEQEWVVESPNTAIVNHSVALIWSTSLPPSEIASRLGLFLEFALVGRQLEQQGGNDFPYTLSKVYSIKVGRSLGNR